MWSRLAQQILAPKATSHGTGGTLVFQSFRNQYEVDMYIVCQNTRADGSKGNSTANMFLEVSLQEFTYNEYVNYIKGSGLYVTYASHSSKKNIQWS